jgi:hypothetical protein
MTNGTAALAARIKERVSVQDGGYETPCWISDRAHNGTGYTKICVVDATGRKRTVYTHRAAYEVFVGPIAEGLTIDHLCRNRACCNPAHLEPTTMRENTLRGESQASIHARQTHCLRGHEFTPSNTYRMRGAHGVQRLCRTCRLEQQRASYRRRRASAA